MSVLISTEEAQEPESSDTSPAKPRPVVWDDPDARSFVVLFWSQVFNALRYVSLLELLMVLARQRRLLPLRRVLGTYWFVEAWCMAHLTLSLVAVCAARYAPGSAFAIALAAYGIIRTAEIVVTQTNILLFAEFRARRAGKPYRIRGYRRMVILLMQNFAEIVFWFAATYGVMRGGALSPHDVSVLGLIRESFIATVSFGSSAPGYGSTGALALLGWQGFVGLFVTLLSLARFIGLIPPPESMEPTETTRS
jgi:hypothetical protein